MYYKNNIHHPNFQTIAHTPFTYKNSSNKVKKEFNCVILY